MSDFSALNTAFTGLQAHRKRIDVIGENIANAETPGYHRQVAHLNAIDTYRPGVFAGRRDRHSGVTAEVRRRWDELLDTNAKQERSRSASFEIQATALSSLEADLGPVGEGLSARLQELWNSFDDVANNPDDLGVRNVVIGNADAVASALRAGSQTIDGTRTGALERLEAKVTRINELSARIAELDHTVVTGGATGHATTGVRDERDRLTAELAELIGGQISYNQNGQLRYSVDGHNLVSDGIPGTVSVAMTPDTALAALGYQRVSIVATSGRTLRLTGGAVHGGLQIVNELIPAQLTALNNVAAATVNTVNALHQAGAGLDGGTGRSLFDTSGVAAVDVAVSTDVVGQPEKLAASDGSALLDNSVARAIADLAEDTAGPSGTHAQFVADLGIEVDKLNGRADASRLASDHAEEARQSAVGVSLDEELADLVSAQRAYEASSRMISAVDEMLDVLINRTGLVGR
ncbi:MAG: flagellar hook-associated protein FlgK [Acidimicrobiia bacterium]|nr:flagellar hook-associated protein FlgK [Acidimicrobiia bacterium]